MVCRIRNYSFTRCMLFLLLHLLKPETDRQLAFLEGGRKNCSIYVFSEYKFFLMLTDWSQYTWHFTHKMLGLHYSWDLCPVPSAVCLLFLLHFPYRRFLLSTALGWTQNTSCLFWWWGCVSTSPTVAVDFDCPEHKRRNSCTKWTL